MFFLFTLMIVCNHSYEFKKHQDVFLYDIF
jgi:hypothetical protein